MVNSYDDMMGSETDPSDHPATNVPQATQHYAGDVVPIRDTKDSVNMIARINQFQNRIRSPSRTDDSSNVVKINSK